MPDVDRHVEGALMGGGADHTSHHVLAQRIPTVLHFGGVEQVARVDAEEEYCA